MLPIPTALFDVEIFVCITKANSITKWTLHPLPRKQDLWSVSQNEKIFDTLFHCGLLKH